MISSLRGPSSEPPSWAPAIITPSVKSWQRIFCVCILSSRLCTTLSLTLAETSACSFRNLIGYSKHFRFAHCVVKLGYGFISPFASTSQNTLVWKVVYDLPDSCFVPFILSLPYGSPSWACFLDTKVHRIHVCGSRVHVLDTTFVSPFSYKLATRYLYLPRHGNWCGDKGKGCRRWQSLPNYDNRL